MSECTSASADCDSNSSAPNRRIGLLWSALLLFGVGVLYNTTLTAYHDWGGDFAQYIAQAISLNEPSFDELTEQATYRYENSADRRLGPKYYPWGYPLLLAPVCRSFGLDLVPMKAVTGAFFLCALGTCYVLFRDVLGNAASLFLIAIFGFNPYLFEVRQYLGSDIPFVFLSLLTIWMIRESVVARRGALSGFGGAVLIGVLIFASCIMRASGIVLFPTLLISQFLAFSGRDRVRRLNVLECLRILVPYGTYALLSTLTKTTLPHESSYADQLSLITIGSIVHNLSYYAMLPTIFFTVGSELVGAAIYLATLPLFGLGLYVRGRRDFLYVLFCGLTLVLYVIWPSSRQGLRFLFPLIPYYLYFMIVGSQYLANSVASQPVENRRRGDLQSRQAPSKAPRGSQDNDLRHCFGVASVPRGSLLRKSTGCYRRYTGWLRYAGVGLLGLFLASIAHQLVQAGSNPQPPAGPYRPDSIALFEFIREETADHATFSFFKPRVLTLYTGRRAADLPDWDRLSAPRADYVIWNRTRETPKELQGNEIVFQNDSFTCYRTNSRTVAGDGPPPR